nr:unnamed protein product [Callosobruchus analis]
MRLYQYLAGVGSNFGMMSIGMHYGWSSIALPKLMNGTETDFTITPEDASWLASIVSLGSLLGDVITLFTLDRIGRRFLILGAALPLSLSWFSVPPYLTEISDPEIRGALGSSYPITLQFGMFLMNLFEVLFSMKLSSYLAFLIGIPTFLIMMLVPDSPYFYLLKGKEEAAVKSLQKFTGKQDVSKDLERISEGLQEEGGAHLKFSKALFTPLALRSLLISAGLIIAQQVNGSLAVISYTATVFEESKDFLDPQISNLIFYGVFTLFCFICVFLVDICGRKLLILVSLCSSAVMLFVTGTYIYIKTETSIDVEGMGYIELISVLLYAVSESIGLIFIPLLIISEILPTNVKAVGMLVTNVCFCFSATGVIKFFSWSSNAYGMYIPFFSFTVCSILGVIFVVCFVPETKGKTLEEIHRAMIKTEHKDESVVT